MGPIAPAHCLAALGPNFDAAGEFSARVERVADLATVEGDSVKRHVLTALLELYRAEADLLRAGEVTSYPTEPVDAVLSARASLEAVAQRVGCRTE